MALATAKIIWLKALRIELCLYLHYVSTFFNDNISVEALARNPVFYACTKHIKIDHHFICDQVVQELLQVIYVLSVDQLVNCLIKPRIVPMFTV